MSHQCTYAYTYHYRITEMIYVLANYGMTMCNNAGEITDTRIYTDREREHVFVHHATPSTFHYHHIELLSPCKIPFREQTRVINTFVTGRPSFLALLQLFYFYLCYFVRDPRCCNSVFETRRKNGRKCN